MEFKCFLCTDPVKQNNCEGLSSRIINTANRNDEEDNQDDYNLIKKRKQKELEFLLKYLLGTSSSSLSLSSSSTKCFDKLCKQILDCENVKFCGRCEDKVQNLFNFHIELEVLQMKIVDKVKSIKSDILKAKLFADNYKKLNTLKDYSTVDDKHSILCLFQAAIAEKEKTSYQIPLIFIDNQAYAKRPVEPVLLLYQVPIVKSEVNFEEISSSPFYGEDDDHWADQCDVVTDADDYQIDIEFNLTSLKEETKEKEDVPAKEETCRVLRKRKPGRPPITRSEIATASNSGDDNHEDVDCTIPKKKPKRKLTKGKDLKTNPDKAKVKGKVKQKKEPVSTSVSLLPGEQPPPKPKRKQVFKYDRFSCKICNNFITERFFFYEEHLRSHELPNHKPFKCDLSPDCTATFTNEHYFNLHKSRHKSVRHICDVCPARVYLPDLFNHLKSHVSTPIQCPKCSFCCATRTRYISHILKCHRVGEYVCDLCLQTFRRKSQLFHHFTNDHENINFQSYPCDFPICSKIFSNAAALEHHKNVHRPKKPKTKTKKPKTRPNKKPETIYSCVTCPVFTTPNQFIYEEHLKTHENPEDKPFHCDLDNCPATFTQEQYCLHHKESHTSKKLSCDICSNYFHIPDMLQHLKTHLETPIQCPKCSFTCGKRSTYSYHLTYSHQKGEQTCDLCFQLFPNKQRLFHHYTEEHKAYEALKCDIDGCTFTFKDHVTFAKHIRNHKNQNLFCRECQVFFRNPETIRRHKLMVHKQDPSQLFYCDQCPKFFYQLKILENHIKKGHHHVAQEFICEICKRVFIKRQYVMQHKRLFHKDMKEFKEQFPFNCDVCGKSFDTDMNLSRHELIHNKKPAEPRVYQCDKCGKSYTVRRQYTNHMKVHKPTKGKDYVCHECGKGFRRGRWLQDHMSIHTGQKGYPCACGKAYTQYTSRTKHQKKCKVFQQLMANGRESTAATQQQQQVNGNESIGSAVAAEPALPPPLEASVFPSTSTSSCIIDDTSCQ